MKIKGKISIFINQGYTSIEIEDDEANTTFVKVTMTPEQLSSALSRLSHTDCELEVSGISRVGKKHEHKTFEFRVPAEIKADSSNDTQLRAYCQTILDDGWISDGYFSSQSSFFKAEDGSQWARVTCRRWVDPLNQ